MPQKGATGCSLPKWELSQDQSASCAAEAFYTNEKNTVNTHPGKNPNKTYLQHSIA